MVSRSRTVAAMTSMLVLTTTGCIPLTVGSTARPVAPGESTRSMSFYTVPNSFVLDSSRGVSRVGVDPEIRYGLDNRSDVGIRFPSYSGIVMNYKRRLNGESADSGVAVAVMGGGGVVNLGDHAHFELTLLASGRQGSLTPYGGLRAMQVIPITQGAVRDSPTFGGFAGIRIGGDDFAFSPEIGVFHDRSALGIRNGSIIIVPAVTISRTGGRRRYGGLW